MELININYICESFYKKYYNNIDEILNDIKDFSEKSKSDKINTYDIIKGFKSILAYCGYKQINLNNFFKLKIE